MNLLTFDVPHSARGQSVLPWPSTGGHQTLKLIRLHLGWGLGQRTTTAEEDNGHCRSLRIFGCQKNFEAGFFFEVCSYNPHEQIDMDRKLGSLDELFWTHCMKINQNLNVFRSFKEIKKLRSYGTIVFRNLSIVICS